MEDSPNNQNHTPWEKLNKDQTLKIAGRWSTLQMGKFVVLLIVFALLSLQPIIADFYKNEQDVRKSEILKSEKQSESALELAKAAISEVAILSARQGELKAENETLRRQSSELKEALAILNEKYKEMEIAYNLALEEKKKLELRIDELFKTTLKNPIKTQ